MADGADAAALVNRAYTDAIRALLKTIYANTKKRHATALLLTLAIRRRTHRTEYAQRVQTAVSFLWTNSSTAQCCAAAPSRVEIECAS
jgi:hypothetical protein